MVELTKAEEQMMQYLWKLGEGPKNPFARITET